MVFKLSKSQSQAPTPFPPLVKACEGENVTQLNDQKDAISLRRSFIKDLKKIGIDEFKIGLVFNTSEYEVKKILSTSEYKKSKIKKK